MQMGALYLGFYFSTVEAIAPNSTKIIIEMHADLILISYLATFINYFGNSIWLSFVVIKRAYIVKISPYFVTRSLSYFALHLKYVATLFCEI